ncbi:uncharacterized protein LOC117321279 [Pecten maximus]|uniref:uncharacterized protein LOC117321279 n=1 Tax=Pecten maximus TaxID=6579 RepID=UPI00145900D9|nr:uncharacterized protein LOC117321279 [Pecten maximus]
MEMEDKGHRCGDCGKIYKSKRNLNRHRNVSHADNIKVKYCHIDGCERSFTRTEYLKLHLTRVHKLSIETARGMAKDAVYNHLERDNHDNATKSLFDLIEEISSPESPPHIPDQAMGYPTPVGSPRDNYGCEINSESEPEEESMNSTPSSPHSPNNFDDGTSSFDDEEENCSVSDRREILSEETFTIKLMTRTVREGNSVTTERNQIFEARCNGRQVPPYNVDWNSFFTFLKDEISEHSDKQYSRNAEDVEDLDQ